MAARSEVTQPVARRRRTTKDPDVRREELLRTAWDLCRNDGFEAMSVDQLTQVAGVAKGTFYHYFASKDAMLEQLVQRFGTGLFDHLSAAAAATTTGTAAERLRAIMDAAASYKLDNLDTAYASFLYRPGNFALRHRLLAAWREPARQVLVPVIADGQADGSLNVADVQATTDLVLLLWFDATDQLWERALSVTDVDAFVEVMLAGRSAIYQAQERILGASLGTYSQLDDAAAAPLLRRLYPTLDRKQ